MLAFGIEKSIGPHASDASWSILGEEVLSISLP